MNGISWWCSATSAPWTWEWRAYPGVWFVVGLLLAWGVRRNAGAGGTAWTRARWVLGCIVVWLSLDWPIGPLGTSYLASVHTTQYLLLTFFAAPLLLTGVPQREVASGVTRIGLKGSLVALLVYHVALFFTHLPVIVDRFLPTQLGTFVSDILWIVGGVALWWPILHPVQARRLSPGAAMLYLFLATLLPKIPAAMLIFADYAIYGVYELAPRAASITVRDDEQLAGLLMWLAADPFVWVAFGVQFMKWQRLSAADAGRPPTPHATAP